MDKEHVMVMSAVSQEAKSLPHVGKRLADKIWEIAQSGELREFKELEKNEFATISKLFLNIWGVGPHTAVKWYNQVSFLNFNVRHYAS